MPSRPFKPYMGKNTFGVLKESQDAGQYILNKTASTSFCIPNVCVPSRTLASQSSRLILRKAELIIKINYYLLILVPIIIKSWLIVTTICVRASIHSRASDCIAFFRFFYN